MTPRKPKQPRQSHHRHTPSLVPASDYDSDLPLTTHAHTLPSPLRTNTELNLSVLRRYNPSILTILSIAANAVIYSFTPSTQSWEKSGVEGTLFVCETTASPANNAVTDAEYCIVVLNRRGLDNLILDLECAEDVEVAGELIILRLRGEQPGTGEGIQQKVMGIWIHEDKDDTREVNAGLIQQCWNKVATAKKEVEAMKMGVKEGDAIVDGSQTGRRISLTDLFGQKSVQ